MIAVVAAFLLCASILPKDAVYADYPANLGLEVHDAPLFDGTCIVRSLGISRNDAPRYFSFCEEAVVISSATIEPGTAVFIRAPSSRRPYTTIPHYRMTAGKNYLVIGIFENKHSLPVLGYPLVNEKKFELNVQSFEPSSKENEVEALSAFHTEKSELDLKAPPAERLKEGLFDCMEGETVDETIRLVRFLRPMDPIPVTNYGLGTYTDIPCTKLLRSVADDYPPYQRAMLYQLLVYWRVNGSEKPFIEALMACSEDPEAFSDPRSLLDADLDFTVVAIPQRWNRYRPPASELFDCIIECQSASLLHYYVTRVNCIGNPTLIQLQQMLERLPEITVDEAKIDFCNILAGQLGRSEMQPVVKVVNAQEQWINKLECLTFWNRVLKADAIRRGTVSEIGRTL